MIKEYLIFNIDNCAEHYVSISKILDSATDENDLLSVPDNLQNRIYKYQCEEQCREEKVFAMIAREIKSGSLEMIDTITVRTVKGSAMFLRIRHGRDDATIEYIYLNALLYKFPKLVCLLYTEEDINQKYAVLSKAEEFFYGFSGREQVQQYNIFGEVYSFIDNMWQIVRMRKREIRQGFENAKHFKVTPLIKLSEENQEIQFWRSSIGSHTADTKDNDDKYYRVIERCQKNFTEEFKGISQKRIQHYKKIYESDRFKKEVEDMPLLAFYLFCMQMYYLKKDLKKGQVFSDEQIKRIRLYARDIADGVLQLMENIYHATGKTGFMNIRVHENTSEKCYLYKRYGIKDKKYLFYYEIRILDISQENIVESFQKRMKNISGADKLQVSHFFRRPNDEETACFWETYNQTEENLVHHYGLQVFASIVSANGGVFKVISSSRYDYDEQNEKYVNGDNWSKGDSGQVHLPGTEYIVLLPLRVREQKFVTSLEVDAEYQYDMDADYEVCQYEDTQINELVMKDVYRSQEHKEEVINKLAKSMFDGINKLECSIDKSKVFIVFFSIERWMNGFLEIYCKALILCGIWRKSRNSNKFFCVISGCTENQILEIARLFAIFYCKTDIHRYMSDMQIYLVGEEEELLITGRNLDSLYAVTSKIMLVRGISKETTNIMKYLLTQYGNQSRNNIMHEYSTEILKLIPFDILDFPNATATLFEKNVKQTLNADIQKYSLGCKINNTHMRIGSKLHITSFFEAELLFHNNYYVSRFAELILKRLPTGGNGKIVLVGYETYSELLLYKIVTKLRNKYRDDGTRFQASYMVYEQKTDVTFRYMDDECLGGEEEKELQFAIIIPINSTLTTHNKVRSALAEELEKKETLRKKSFKIIANYALILVRSSSKKELDNLEKKFWDEISGRRIRTSLIPEGEPDVEYFVCVNTKWHSPLKCPVCFPIKYIDERPLIETNKASIVPVQMLGVTEPDLISHEKKEIDSDNLERVKALKGSLYYKHVIRNGNHYLYYFCLEKYFIQEQKGIKKWLQEEYKKRKEISNKIVYDIIVSPLHYSNAGFLAEVNHYLFDDAALVLNFEVEKEFRENVKTKYSNIIGLYYNLLKIGKRALIRFHFVDDTIVSAKTYTRAKTLFQSLIRPVNDNVKIEIFSDVVVLLNRMSSERLASLVNSDIIGSNVKKQEEHFHAYVHLNISSMRNHEDACTECKLVSNFANLRDQSSTNQQYSFWNARIRQHLPVEIRNNIQEELSEKRDERKERAYRRMLCTHIFNERLGNLGYEKNDVNKVRNVMIALLSEQQDEQLEWIISYVKVFSRPFISFSKSNREAIFQIMLWIIEYITKDFMAKRNNMKEYKEIRCICGYIQDQHKKSDKIICNLLITLMKRLSDLGSNYIIRKNNIVNILETSDKLGISDDEKRDFRNRYIGMIKRICCQSSDENKSIYFEYLMLFGEEYTEIRQVNTLDTEKELFNFVKREKDFAEIAFLENTRVLNDGIQELSRDYKKIQKSDSQKKKSIVELLKEYYYENFLRLFIFYGYGSAIEKQLTDDGINLLNTLVNIYQYLGGKTDGGEDAKEMEENGKEKDAATYYQHLLELLGKLTGAKKCYFLYKAAMEGTGDKVGSAQYYRIQSKANVEYLRISSEKLGIEKMKADTYVSAFEVEEDEEKYKRAIIKYDIYDGNKTLPINTIFLQIDFPEEFSECRVLILLKMVMVFRGMILQHLQHDFSNNMIQKWSAREYFNKQVMLQRATDHTDRDNLLKYYNELLKLGQCNEVDMEEQRERNRALFHMVINSYIARMNVQLLAEANPEREPSRAAFKGVYDSQLKALLYSLQKVENCRILDEKGEEKFSVSLLERKVRLRQTELGESLSLRRISIIIAELVLSAISHSGKKGKPDVYIYREGIYLVVRNQFYSKKRIEKVRKDIKDSIERKKDGISLATIQGTVNDCYGLSEDNGVKIEAESEKEGKFFYVKLPILQIWDE